MKKTDEENKNMETYKLVIQFLNNEVNLNWQRLNNSLLANSILIAAWALLYTQINSLPEAKVFLLGVSLIGFILSFFWVFATTTGNAYHGYWLLWVNFLEKKLHPEENRQLVHNIFEKMRDLQVEKAVRIDSDCEPVKCCFCRKVFTPDIKYEKHTIQMPHFPSLRVMNYFACIAVLFLAIYFILLLYSMNLLFRG